MLLSPQFVASTFIGETEVPPLLEKAVVIPVGLHEVPLDGSVKLWGLDRLQFFLHKNQPFEAFDHPRDQRAFAAELFRRLLQELRTAATTAVAAPAAKTPVAPVPVALASPRPAPSAPAIQFSAEPDRITAGESAVLRWTVTGADSVRIEPAVGAVQPSGSRPVSPAESTTYTLSATGAGGRAEAQAVVVVVAKPVPKVVPGVGALLSELQREATTHERRWEIGQRLAEVGDPRPGVGLVDGVPDFLWRAIPAGPKVKAFQMAAYAVTAGQYRAFVAAKDGYGDKRWWKGLKQGSPDSDWEKMTANHPVTDVSWYDATAYCRWVSERVGYEVRLADEAEWEWAARGAQPGYEYPWGAECRDGVANTWESKLRKTTAVGMYPAGESAQQVADLAGNIWEWCENRDSSEPEGRVFRGGSWNDDQDFARAEGRAHFPSVARSSRIGFRLVCPSPIH